MDDYLSKPISPKTLLEKIDLWLARSEGEERASA
jgi:DNA-binding response OmpR family regulator